MIAKLFSRSRLHEHADPAQRVAGIAELPPNSDDLTQLLLSDPAAEVRAAAAARCNDLAALATAWQTETAEPVRAALVAALATALSTTEDAGGARALIDSDHCTDGIRCEIARRTTDAERRRLAITSVREEEALVELALAAEHAETRLAAAERVRSPEALRRLADAAKSKDRGVARIARQRIDTMQNDQSRAEEADAILAEVEGLPDKAGPILTELIELNRRWQALDMSADAARLTRWDAARARVQSRFEREQDMQRNRARFERRLAQWTGGLHPPQGPEGLAAPKDELGALRTESQEWGDELARAQLDRAELRITQWAAEFEALAAAEALVVEAEQRAATDVIDDANLPQRWRALDSAARNAALSRRFEAALQAIAQRRVARDQAIHQQAGAVRQQLHGLLHAGEQALGAGQLHKARAAADEIKTIRSAAGLLPKPTLQRLGRLMQQLTELERWESFGQQGARVRLCERAEALAADPLDPARLAQEVQALRNEWKALDQQHAGVPKGLWERFDGACRKAYAPAAKHFAEVAAQRKEARRQREQFIDAATAHAPILLNEPRDWRAIERWLRETDKTWREGGLGSVEPGVWKELDGRLKAALGPLRESLSAARGQGKSARQALIAEVAALAPKAMERDTVSQVKAIQSRWQQEAKALPLAQRDERPLWEAFRAACDAVFDARQAKRKEVEKHQQDHRAALAEICAQMEQLAKTPEKPEQEVRRAMRDLQEQWKKSATGPDSALAAMESRFRNARSAVEAALAARSRTRETAVWETLAAKERLCEELDRLASGVSEATQGVDQTAAVNERWSALPPLSKPWEQAMVARRDAALRALAEPGAARTHAARMAEIAAARRERLLELEILLDLDTPPELQADKRALQVKQLRERFSGTASPNNASAAQRLVTWCAEPGITEAPDRQRAERLFAKIALTR